MKKFRLRECRAIGSVGVKKIPDAGNSGLNKAGKWLEVSDAT